MGNIWQQNWRDSPGRLKVLDKYIRRLVTVKNTKSDFPRRIEGTLTVHLEALGNRTCSPATAAHLLRCRIN